MKIPKTKAAIITLGLYLALLILTSSVGSMAYFHYGDPRHTCASCHEMGGVHSEWANSGHQTLHCRNCHGGSLTLETHAIESHLNRVVQHFVGDTNKPIRLTEKDVLRAQTSCRDCHPQSYADWKSGGHAASYSRIFLDAGHNSREQLADDCLRCHGMFFDGAMSDLVTPLDKTGPWSLKDPAKASHPTIPCSACHQIHNSAGGSQPSKAHFYDGREKVHFPVSGLPKIDLHHEEPPSEVGKDGKQQIVDFLDGIAAKRRPVEVAKEANQRLCMQCHSPSQFHAHLPGTSDDLTPTGVHEGLSCLDCHQKHNNSARDSCATCHSSISNCGLDVEKMDTTFFSKTSKHNIHTVACGDCHDGQRPVPKSGEVKK